MSSIQRITGTNSGLDVDTLVKSSLKPYQTRVDKETQNKKVLEYQQEQYRQMMTDSSDFYDKYCDVLKTGSLRTSSTYQTLKFTAPDGSKVSAKGLAGAKLDNYTVSVSQLAAKATDSLGVNDSGDVTIKIGTAQVKFAASADGKKTVTNYNNALAEEKTKLNNIIKGTEVGDKNEAQLKLDDLNSSAVTAQFSEFTKNVTFTASAFGGKGFTLNVGGVDRNKVEDKYLEATIKNSSGAVYTVTSADKKTSNNMTIDSVQFSFLGAATSKASTPTSAQKEVVPLKALDLGDAGTTLQNLTDLKVTDLPTTVQNIADLADDSTTLKYDDGSKTTTLTLPDPYGTKTITTVTKGKQITTTEELKDANNKTLRTTTKSSNTEDGSLTITEVLADGTKYIHSKSAVDTDTGEYTETVSKEKADGTIIGTTTDGNTKTGVVITTTDLTIPYAGSATPLTKEIVTSGNTQTIKTNLKSGDSTTTITEVKDTSNNTSTTTTVAEGTVADGSSSATTINEVKNTSNNTTTSRNSTTTNFKVNDDSSTTKTVTATGGTPLSKLTPLTALIDDNVNTKNVTTANGVETTTLTKADGTTTKIEKLLADGTITTTTTKDGATTVIASDGTITTTAADGTKTVTANSITTTTKLGTDGSLITTIDGGETTTTTANNYTGTTLTGQTDVSDIKSKILKFVDDYNTFLKSINTKLYEKRDKDYMPLTDEQKKAMSEDQIKTWETKAKTGLLRRDNDLDRIAGEMKSAMSTVMSGSGLYLEQIGINPVKYQYTDKNGLFTVDEDKLTKALEEDGGSVMDLFMRSASMTDTNDKGGIITKLSQVIRSEFKTSTSSLSKKAGLAGSTTESDNTLTKGISEKTTLIKRLNQQLSTKEDALYKKYSDLETMMEKLNSQQSSLASLLGSN